MVIFSINLERANENDGFKMTVLEIVLVVSIPKRVVKNGPQIKIRMGHERMLDFLLAIT